MRWGHAPCLPVMDLRPGWHLGDTPRQHTDSHTAKILAEHTTLPLIQSSRENRLRNVISQDDTGRGALGALLKQCFLWELQEVEVVAGWRRQGRVFPYHQILRFTHTFASTTGAGLLRFSFHFPPCSSPDDYYKSSGNIALSSRRNILSFWLLCQREGRGRKLFVVHGVNFFSLPPCPSEKRARPWNFQMLGTASEGRQCFLDKQSTTQQLISKSTI